MANKILILSDPHLPFICWKTVAQAYKFKQEFKPDLIVCTGDLLDEKAWGKFQRYADDPSAQEEWDEAVLGANEFARRFPKLVMLRSNHDARYMKRAAEAGLVKAMVRPLSEIIKAPGWKWHMDSSPYIIPGTNIACMHGDEGQGMPIATAAILGYNIVQGHSHKASLHYLNTFDKQLFGMDAGCMMDGKSKAARYAALRLRKVWNGFGYIENNVPHLIPKI